MYTKNENTSNNNLILSTELYISLNLFKLSRFKDIFLLQIIQTHNLQLLQNMLQQQLP